MPETRKVDNAVHTRTARSPDEVYGVLPIFLLLQAAGKMLETRKGDDAVHTRTARSPDEVYGVLPAD